MRVETRIDVVTYRLLALSRILEEQEAVVRPSPAMAEAVKLLRQSYEESKGLLAESIAKRSGGDFDAALVNAAAAYKKVRDALARPKSENSSSPDVMQLISRIELLREQVLDGGRRTDRQFWVQVWLGVALFLLGLAMQPIAEWLFG